MAILFQFLVLLIPKIGFHMWQWTWIWFVLALRNHLLVWRHGQSSVWDSVWTGVWVATDFHRHTHWFSISGWQEFSALRDVIEGASAPLLLAWLLQSAKAFVQRWNKAAGIKRWQTEANKRHRNAVFLFAGSVFRKIFMVNGNQSTYCISGLHISKRGQNRKSNIL